MSLTVQKAESSKAEANKAGKKKEESFQSQVMWAYLYMTMAHSYAVSMQDAQCQQKAFLKTENQASALNDILNQMQYQMIVKRNSWVLVGGAGSVANDQTRDVSVTYFLTINGGTVKDNKGNLLGFSHGRAGNLDSVLDWYLECGTGSIGAKKAWVAKEQANGGADIHLYRNKVIQADYDNINISNERMDAQRDFFQNKYQGLQQGMTVQGGVLNTDGSVGSQELNFIDNVLNLAGKMGDEGSQQ